MRSGQDLALRKELFAFSTQIVRRRLLQACQTTYSIIRSLVRSPYERTRGFKAFQTGFHFKANIQQVVTYDDVKCRVSLKSPMLFLRLFLAPSESYSKSF